MLRIRDEMKMSEEMKKGGQKNDESVDAICSTNSFVFFRSLMRVGDDQLKFAKSKVKRQTSNTHQRNFPSNKFFLHC